MLSGDLFILRNIVDKALDLILLQDYFCFALFHKKTVVE